MHERRVWFTDRVHGRLPLMGTPASESPPPLSASEATAKAHDAFVASLRNVRIGGRYVVGEILGRGGMGIVAAGQHPDLDQDVAIKFMWPELASNETLAHRFRREAKVAAKVHSPHLVRVFDVGTLESGVPYMVMERLHGRDLHSEIRTRGPFPIPEAIEYLLQAASGVAEIHARGVVHRDLKPSNLFVAEQAGSHVVKVLDFGVSKEIARKETAALTATENLLGTPQYMSPEQIRASKHVDARADIWSLGVILYELLTGSLPFVGESEGVGEMFGLILFTPPRKPRELRPDLPTALEDVIMRCIRQNPADRFASVVDLADALLPFTAPSSAVRVEAIRRTLGGAKEIGPITPPNERPTARGANRTPQPRESDAEIAMAETSFQGVESVRSGVAASASSGSAPGSGTSSEAERATGKRRTLAAAGIGLIVVLAAAGIALGRAAGSPPNEGAASAVEPAADPPQAGRANAAADPPQAGRANADVPTPSPPESALAASPPAQAAAAEMAAPTATATVPPKATTPASVATSKNDPHKPRHAASSSAPAVAPPPPPAGSGRPSAADLILDRK